MRVVSDLKNDYLVGVFLKNHHTEAVKTRLAKSVGVDAATELYTRMVQLLMDTLAVFSRDRVQLVVMGSLKGLTYPYSMQLQSPGDLGDKMGFFFQSRLKEFSRVLLIGTDCPYTSVDPLLRGLKELENVNAVFQPALDGGYTLIGLRSFIPGIFKNIPWSTDQVMQTSRQVLRQSDQAFSELEPRRDIDTLEDLRAWLKEAESRTLKKYFSQDQLSPQVFKLVKDCTAKSS